MGNTASLIGGEREPRTELQGARDMSRPVYMDVHVPSIEHGDRTAVGRIVSCRFTLPTSRQCHTGNTATVKHSYRPLMAAEGGV